MTPASFKMPSAGVVLDGYKLLAGIASGSCGTVFQAENTISGERVALKIFPGQGSLADRELQAVRLYQSIEHPNLIRIHHVGQKDDMLFYTMDWCESSLAERKVSAEELAEIAKKLTGALAELHKHGLIHRDIKPDNILFRNGEIVLGDIGLVTRGENATYAGSPGFMVPGQSTPNEYSDCYALAKSLYCALSGEKPDNFPFYPGTLSQSAGVIMRAALAVCSNPPKIRTAAELQHFLNKQEKASRPGKFKLLAWLSAAILIPVLAAGGFFLRLHFQKQDGSGSPQTIRTAKPDKRQTTPSRPEKIVIAPKSMPVQREIQKRPPVRKRKPAVRRQKKTEITERRAWNEQNRILISKCTSPVQRADLEFEIEWNNLRIDFLERRSGRKLGDAESYREERNLVSLWKTAKWLIKSGIGAEKLDSDYGELKEKLTIPDIGLYQQWVQADLDWQTHKQDCVKELLRRTKETGRDAADLLQEMAKKDKALQFFGIDQEKYLGEYEKIRFSGSQDAKQRSDEAIAKYLQRRKMFLRSQSKTDTSVRDSAGTGRM